MPITPLHFGINGFVASLNNAKIDVSSAVLANIVLDIQPFLALIMGLNIPVHGVSHTLLGAGLICLICSMLYGYSVNFFVSHPKPISTYINGWLLGGFLHLILDSFVHQDVKFFYPISNFNFANHATNMIALAVCGVGYLLWIIALS